jgi:hypothetical protein
VPLLPNTLRKQMSTALGIRMLCFELLTRKVSFEDSHLQGEKMSQNIRAGERPLFLFSPGYPDTNRVANLGSRLTA